MRQLSPWSLPCQALSWKALCIVGKGLDRWEKGVVSSTRESFRLEVCTSTENTRFGELLDCKRRQEPMSARRSQIERLGREGNG